MSTQFCPEGQEELKMCPENARFNQVSRCECDPGSVRLAFVGVDEKNAELTCVRLANMVALMVPVAVVFLGLLGLVALRRWSGGQAMYALSSSPA